MHNHGHGQDNTSNIKQLWAHLKSIFKNLYYSIPHKHFILFLLEAEFRRNLKNLNYENKQGELLDATIYTSKIGIENLYSEEELLSID